jgi:NAD(P)H dehydrogenase (quinone)
MEDFFVTFFLYLIMEDVNVLIVYDSITGNVEKMAKAVLNGVKEAGGNARISLAENVEEETIVSYDAYAFGSPTHCGTMSAKMNDFFNNKMHKHWGKLGAKVAVAFTSSGGLGGGNEMTLLSLISVILNFGLITFGVPDYVSENVTLHYGAVSIKEPGLAELKACRLLGKRLVEYTMIIKKGVSSLQSLA